VVESKTISAPWLQSQSGERTFIGDSCQIGRGPNNSVTLHSEKVSRRHAIVHAQGQNEFWLIDLGSANGTYLNGRRVSQPTRLSDSDVITIADYRLQFFHPEQSRPAETDTANKTIQEIRNLNLWMLLADVESGTVMVQRTPEEAPRVMGRWLASCKQVIDQNGGTINKFLGDGFFAYWIEKEGTAAAVAKTIETFKQAQETGDPRFRVVVHFGKVFVGGAANMGEDSLMGNEVNFVFRVEKLAAKLVQHRLLTEAASKQLGSIVQTESAGSHAVTSFEGVFPFFTY
jgi:adenylate cyclase